MSKENISILVIGSSSSKLKQQTAFFSSLVPKDLINQHLLDRDDPKLPFHQKNAPEIVIFLMDQHNSEILDQLSYFPNASKPDLIVITEKNDSDLMRLAMRAGARDFFTDPINESELQKSLKQFIADRKIVDTRQGILTTVINAKGGSGCSLISCNLAHISSAASPSRTLLMDMDLQFGTQSLLLDVRPIYSIVEALNDIEVLDREAIEGFMARNKNGLRLLSALHEQVILPGEISPEHLNKLLSLILNHYDRVFVDLPRQIDPLSVALLEKSDQIVVVVQQSLSHLRDAKRLVHILKSELNVSVHNIFIVVNRFSTKSSLQLKDIRDSVGCSNLVQIPNDYERVATTTNLGIPLFEYSRKAPITKAMIELAETLNVDIEEKYRQSSFFSRLFNRKKRYNTRKVNLPDRLD